jgi:mRNA-degrading endonuclease toxin of MazEF toxin-antitoxin module
MSRPDEKIRRGDIWVIEPVGFPKPRPALVMSINPVNDFCPEVLLVPLTTKAGPLRVPMNQPAETTGLDSESFAKCESLGPVHKNRLKRRIGHIPRAELAEVERGVKRVLGLN